MSLVLESMFSGRYSSLCRPDPERTCFRCCPPIRPAGYEHLAYRSSLRRALIENTTDYRHGEITERPITGFWCWGLGYLDGAWSTIGCLLHPAQNQGTDLRDLTGYGDKCRRELCREARAFTAFPPALQAFLLDLSAGLDSFEYSSSETNPVFRLVDWGPIILEALRQTEPSRLSRDDYRRQWPALAKDLDPYRDRFPVELLLNRIPLAAILEEPFIARYRTAMHAFVARHNRKTQSPYDRRPYLHGLALPEGFVRFLRTALGRNKSTYEETKEIREALELMLARLNPMAGRV